MPRIGLVGKRIITEAKELVSDMLGVSYEEIHLFDLHWSGHRPDCGWLASDTMEADRVWMGNKLYKSGKLDCNALSVPGEEGKFLKKVEQLIELMAMIYYLTATGVARAPEFVLLRWYGSESSPSSFHRYRGLLMIHSVNQKSARYCEYEVLRFLPECASQLYMKVFRFIFPMRTAH